VSRAEQANTAAVMQPCALELNGTVVLSYYLMSEPCRHHMHDLSPALSSSDSV